MTALNRTSIHCTALYCTVLMIWRTHRAVSKSRSMQSIGVLLADTLLGLKILQRQQITLHLN